MTRLHTEWQRLYLPPTAADPAELTDQAPLVDAQGHVRALVLSVSQPADWPTVAALWQAVQAELELPAPAIAVSGTDSYQLWFSLAEAVPAAQAHAFLAAVRGRYLADIKPSRVGLLPAVDPSAPDGFRHVTHRPGQAAEAEQWASFVARDLAPVFADTPWLDIAPSAEGQAELLSHLRSISPAQWDAALAMLQPEPAHTVDTKTPSQGPTGSAEDAEEALTPQRFLTQVMNDRNAPLALRIEAAKALLADTPAGVLTEQRR